MMRLCVFVLLASVACVLGASLPVRRVAHTGPARRLGVTTGRIYGGHDAARGEFPYLVSLKIGGLFIKRHNCGGSIITSTSVLTAAHCVSNLGSYVAVAGELDLSTDEGTEQEARVSQMIPHPDYPSGNNVNPNDIAVFRLRTAFTFNSYVQPISLPNGGVIPTAGSSAVASGWGLTEDSSQPDILQTVDVVVIDEATCRQLVDNFVSENPLTDTMICTGPVTGGISLCNGDSGGPLAQNGTLIGVASWVITPCGREGGPTMHTRVSAFLDFVNENI
ncbi:trypsin-1-like [Schistocerca nitens]|uniref:trypsin-1-like n=1 Tax=Schistocerca nitens TaxID=7011 RepID=UPI0021179FDB|nr:trypsin-1-like [Schistocerca nitens]